MHFPVRLILTAFFTVALSTGIAVAQSDASLETDEEKFSYSVGVGFADIVKRSGAELDIDLIMRGMTDALSGNDLAMSQEDLVKAVGELQKMTETNAVKVATKTGQEFLDSKAKEDGVVVLPSGLQYKVIRKGSGKSPRSTSTVETHYRGTFVNGLVFDSSYDRGQPAQFPVNRVIPGWTEALQLMKEGGKWELYIPYDLAYGAQGRAGIPPYSVLIFEIELLRIVN